MIPWRMACRRAAKGSERAPLSAAGREHPAPPTLCMCMCTLSPPPLLPPHPPPHTHTHTTSTVTHTHITHQPPTTPPHPHSWINACVGLANMRYFLGFLLATAAVCLYGAVPPGRALCCAALLCLLHRAGLTQARKRWPGRWPASQPPACEGPALAASAALCCTARPHTPALNSRWPSRHSPNGHQALPDCPTAARRRRRRGPGGAGDTGRHGAAGCLVSRLPAPRLGCAGAANAPECVGCSIAIAVPPRG